MTFADRRWWMENTAPGHLAKAMGRDPWAVDHDRVDAEVEATEKFYKRTYGRDLSDSELAAVRIGAEARSVPVLAQTIPADSYELAAAVKRANPGKRSWTVRPAADYDGAGIAIKMGGQWTADSDPAVVAATEAAEAAKQVANETAYEAWRRGPGKSIGPPT